MCILRIPKHTWCDCADPVAVDAWGKPTCPHHMHIDPDSIRNITIAISDQGEAPVLTLLSNIPRHGLFWEHCPTYLKKRTDPATGELTLGLESVCRETMNAVARMQADREPGFKEPYAWGGLCTLCGPAPLASPLDAALLRFLACPAFRPSTPPVSLQSSTSPSQIRLPLVPLEKALVEEPDGEPYMRVENGKWVEPGVARRMEAAGVVEDARGYSTKRVLWMLPG